MLKIKISPRELVDQHSAAPGPLCGSTMGSLHNLLLCLEHSFFAELTLLF